MFGLMTLKEFAKELGKPESTVRTWKRRGELPSEIFVTIGSSVFVKIELFKDWIGKTA